MALQFGDDAVDEIVEAAPRAVALPALGWLKQSGRAPGWHGGLQPFIEALLHPFVASAANQQRTARIGCSLVDPPENDGIGLSQLPHPPVSPVLSGRDQALPIPSSKIPGPLTAATARDSKTRLWQLRGRYVEMSTITGRVC